MSQSQRQRSELIFLVPAAQQTLVNECIWDNTENKTLTDEWLNLHMHGEENCFYASTIQPLYKITHGRQ